jgi:osmoprotectant transport system permease protein
MESIVQFLQFVATSRDQILQLTFQHAYLSLAGVVLGTLTAVPLGIFVSRRPKITGYVTDAAGMLYTIPSLALLGLMIPYLGFGWFPTVIALVVYSWLPVLRNTCTGLASVDPAVKEAALGMGVTQSQLLFRVELPLAMPVIMASVRTVAVLTVGITTMGALVGAGGLGVLIFQGISAMDNQMTLAGAIPVAVMAVILDQGIGVVERKLRAKTGVLEGSLM